MYVNTNKHQGSRRGVRWVAITGARQVAGKRGDITGAALALIGEHVFGPPNAKASSECSREPFGPSFLLQTANEAEDEESTARAGASSAPRQAVSPKTQIGIIFKEQRWIGVS